MTLTGMKKHVGVLEQAGLVTTEKVGRVRTCKLGLRALEEEAAWIEKRRQLWAARFDALDKIVEELKRKEKADGAKEAIERTRSERKSERELVVTRTFNAPGAHRVRGVDQARAVQALVGAEIDRHDPPVLRDGCAHRRRLPSRVRPPCLEQPMAFFGKYLEVTPHARIVWTNEESEDGAVTTVTFEEKGGKTLLVLHELYPSKEALDGEIASGATSGMPAQLGQLEEFIISLMRS